MSFLKIFNKKKKNNEVVAEKITEENAASPETQNLLLQDDSLSVFIEEITDIQLLDNKLSEITDNKIIAKIDGIMPSLTNIAVAAADVAESAISGSEPVYRVVLKKGGTLADSRSMPGAKRAMSISRKGIKENANLIEVKPNALRKMGKAAQLGASVMNVASMVVGQYYMQQVDSKILSLKSSVETIVNFLDIEYKSQVVSLLESIYEITKFQMTNIEIEELRNRELDNVQAQKEKCRILLNQAEIHIQELTSCSNDEYSKYVEATQSIEKWLNFRNILLQLLNQISVLDFTLNIGIKSNEHCFDSIASHTEKAERTRKHLIEWHDKQCELLKINLVDKRRKNTGFLALLEKPISYIKDDWNYRTIDSKTISLIQSQLNSTSTEATLSENLFDNDVSLVLKDGKMYYLPQ